MNEYNDFTGLDELIGESSQIKNVLRIVRKVAKTDSTVLITGESGTGKELIARAIHNLSNRKTFPIITINCGAIPAELLESELFGHEKGAFTGAHQTRIGRFEIANGGTIFLDEIGDMDPNLQVKLLRVIQDQTFERVGSTKPIHVDTRILAATNKDLSRAIEEGTFREDLYYRLNVIPIKVAPLRERKEDIPLLVNFFQRKLAARRDQEQKVFSESALAAFMRYQWPGNIRELENLMERLTVLVDEKIIRSSDLPAVFQHQPPPVIPADHSDCLRDGLGFNEAVEEYQKRLILQALHNTNGVKAKAADLLKMNRTTLVEKIKKLKLESGATTGNG